MKITLFVVLCILACSEQRPADEKSNATIDIKHSLPLITPPILTSTHSSDIADEIEKTNINQLSADTPSTEASRTESVTKSNEFRNGEEIKTTVIPSTTKISSQIISHSEGEKRSLSPGSNQTEDPLAMIPSCGDEKKTTSPTSNQTEVPSTQMPSSEGETTSTSPSSDETEIPSTLIPYIVVEKISKSPSTDETEIPSTPIPYIEVKKISTSPSSSETEIPSTLIPYIEVKKISTYSNSNETKIPSTPIPYLEVKKISKAPSSAGTEIPSTPIPYIEVKKISTSPSSNETKNTSRALPSSVDEESSTSPASTSITESITLNATSPDDDIKNTSETISTTESSNHMTELTVTVIHQNITVTTKLPPSSSSSTTPEEDIVTKTIDDDYSESELLVIPLNGETPTIEHKTMKIQSPPEIREQVSNHQASDVIHDTTTTSSVANPVITENESDEVSSPTSTDSVTVVSSTPVKADFNHKDSSIISHENIPATPLPVIKNVPKESSHESSGGIDEQSMDENLSNDGSDAFEVIIAVEPLPDVSSDTVDTTVSEKSDTMNGSDPQLDIFVITNESTTPNTDRESSKNVASSFSVLSTTEAIRAENSNADQDSTVDTLSTRSILPTTIDASSTTIADNSIASTTTESSSQRAEENIELIEDILLDPAITISKRSLQRLYPVDTATDLLMEARLPARPAQDEASETGMSTVVSTKIQVRNKRNSYWGDWLHPNYGGSNGSERRYNYGNQNYRHTWTKQPNRDRYYDNDYHNNYGNRKSYDSHEDDKPQLSFKPIPVFPG